MTSYLPDGRSADIEKPNSATHNRTIIPAVSSEIALRLARNCRDRRVSFNISQTELSKRTGIAASHLSKIENGRGNPTLEILSTIADALQCGVADLLRD